MKKVKTVEKIPAIGIEARGLIKKFGLDTIVNGVDLRVRRGEVVGLLGPNGAGKTTTLRMLAGILKATAGTITLLGYDVKDELFEARRNLGYLSGNTALYRQLTVPEMLAYFGSLHGMTVPEIKDQTDKLTQKLELSPFLKTRCGNLSSGQLQRANLARTLIHDPPILILDEPTTSLDVISGEFIIETIRTARLDGKAVLFSTHIMSEAELLCDRVVLLYDGKVLDDGTQDEILERSGQKNLTDTFFAYAGKKRQKSEQETTCNGMEA